MDLHSGQDWSDRYVMAGRPAAGWDDDRIIIRQKNVSNEIIIGCGSD